jgi:probable phosphoglycerate mutase
VISNVPPIYFVRHGETDWNRSSRIQGQIDIPLNETGHLQSASVARMLKRHVGATTIERFVVSPLARARQTMGYVSREFDHSDAEVEVAPAVSELTFGVWEGRYLHELTADPGYPTDLLSHFHWRPEDGESYEDGLARVRRWLHRIEGPMVIVAHGAIGRCVIGHVCGLGPEDLLRVRTPQGCFCRIQDGQLEWFEGDGAFDGRSDAP